VNRQSAADLQELFDHVPIALYRTTPDGEVVMANRAFAEILGYSSVDEALSCNLAQHPPLAGFARERFKADVEKYGEIRGREWEGRRADGTTVIVREHVHAVRDGDGKVLYYDGAVEDITHLRTIQASLERSEREYELLFGAYPHPMWIFDSDTLCFLAVNDAALVKYGYTRDEFLAKTILDIRPEYEVNRLLEDVHQSEDCLSSSGPWVHQLSDGRTIEVEITSHPTTFAGRAARFVLARDVTDQVHAERILEGREAYYRALIDNALDVITIIDSNGMILFESSSLQRLLGYHPDDAIGMSVFDSVHPDDLAAAQRLLTTGVENGLPAATIQLRMRTAGGEWKTLEACARNLLDDPNIRGIVINSRDITERRKAEEELRRSEERLRLAQRAGRIGT
jgi:two-component system, cell cycle sensor histidine kinase and response regulator CckA